MEESELLPHLFRTEYRKMVSVLCSLFGLEHIETAEDIVSDTFLSATEDWSIKGLPENPTAWLYTVAKNKTKNLLKRNTLFEQKLKPEIQHASPGVVDMEIDFSDKNITDSQLAMIFAVCNPDISTESQIALALNLLCGFGVQEIADGFLTNKEVIYKRINRAKEKLKKVNLKIEQPNPVEIANRLDTVLLTLYLLFSEGYYSTSGHTTLRKDICIEAMRLTYLLITNVTTNKPAVNALFALICFHSSRFDARISEMGEVILYQDQDETLWNRELIAQGEYFLNQAATGDQLSKYHLEAGIAYWHTQKEDTPEKWERILQLYNHLLIREYSPMAALNRTYVLARTNGKEEAIIEAEKLGLTDNPLYYALLGNLYTDLDDQQALKHFEQAWLLCKETADQHTISKTINQLKQKLANH